MNGAYHRFRYVNQYEDVTFCTTRAQLMGYAHDPQAVRPLCGWEMAMMDTTVTTCCVETHGSSCLMKGAWKLMDEDHLVVPLQALAFALIVDDTGRVLLVRHNYGGHFYALPGGAIEPGERPQEAAVREIREELCVEARATRLLSLNSYGGDARAQAHVFLAEITHGTPAHPGTTEIAEIGWFDPDQLPQPIYVTVEDAIADVRHGDYGVLRAIRTFG